MARADVDHFATLVENAAIAENGYNLSVPSYVEAEDTREAVDIKALNAEIARIVERQTELRQDINAIIADLERYRDSLLGSAGRESVRWTTMGEVGTFIGSEWC